MAPPSESDVPPVGRSFVGGFLMGLANLVPGISGGTMILAVGLYDRFIGAVADVTRFRLRPAAVGFLIVLGAGLSLAVVSLSGVAVNLVSAYRWVMYSLFVGLTLGGVPELLRLSRPFSIGVVIAFLGGVGVLLAMLLEFSGAQLPETMPVFLAVGAAGAASMILPGVSGSTVLLILGMYELVIGSLSLSALREDMAGSLRVLVPVVVGAVLGIALLSNLLKFLLARFSRTSHGALLGLLVGSVLILWPFQEPVHPQLASRSTRKATVMILAGESGEAVRAKYGERFDDARLAELATQWSGRTPGDLKQMGEELQYFSPDARQVGLSLVLLVVGFGLTRLLGKKEAEPEV